MLFVSYCITPLYIHYHSPVIIVIGIGNIKIDLIKTLYCLIEMLRGHYTHICCLCLTNTQHGEFYVHNNKINSVISKFD